VTYSGPQQMIASAPPTGGVCVGGSVPGPNGCTSSGPLLPSVGYGGNYGNYGGYAGYGTCYSAYSCGGAYGSCYTITTCGTGLGSCGFSVLAGCSTSACGSSLSCAVNCQSWSSCALTSSTSNSGCRFFYRC
jgi:hypothetical protein